MTEISTAQSDGTADAEGASADDAATGQDAAVEQSSFDREYVQKLRDEAAGYRVRAKRADALNGAWRPHRPL